MLPSDHAENVANLLRNLVNIYSPTGKEQEITGFVHGYLKGCDLPVILQKVDGSRSNILVIPPEVEPVAVMIGHLDTVVAFDLDDFGCREEGDLFEGLGSADMKGGCAAMTEAYVAAWRAAGGRVPVALALVVGEEEEGDGAQKLSRQYHFPWAVIGEPTDMQPCFVHYGYLEIQITTSGRRVHASLANPGRGPVEAMLRLLLRITDYISAKRPDLVYNIRDLGSSRSGFAVPERCDAWLDIHLPPSAPLGEIVMELEEIIETERKESPDFNGTLAFNNVHAGYALPQRGQLVEALKGAYSARGLAWEPIAFRSHSDANLLWAAGIKPVILGPGKLEQAHSPDESVSLEQVLLASKIYYDLIRSVAG